MSNIPSKQREEWISLVTGKKSYPLTNYVLQMKLTQVKRRVQEKQISESEAVDEIYRLCEKYELAVRSDIQVIFGDLHQ